MKVVKSDSEMARSDFFGGLRFMVITVRKL
jgi:hypothetical protein